MVERVYDEDQVGYVEYDGNKVTLRKKFYGSPRYYFLNVKNMETGLEERVKFENAIYSWRSDDER